MNDLQSYIYTCIISADNDEFDLTEDDKQEIITRKKISNDDWEWIFGPIKDRNKRTALIEFFKENETD